MKTLFFTLTLALTLSSPAAFAQQGKAAKKVKLSDPEKYAAALAALLTDYQQQVSAKIAAEELAYTAAAQFYDSAFRINISASLTEDRIIDSERDLADLKSGKLNPDQLIGNIDAYAQNDFDQSRSLYQMDIDSYQTYLSNLHSLEADSQQITVLLQALNDLATPASLGTRLMQIQAYKQSFTQQLHLSNCSMADSLLAVRTAQQTTVSAEIATLAADPESGTLPAKMQKLAALQSQSATLQTQITTLQTQRTNSGGLNSAGTCQAQ